MPEIISTASGTEALSRLFEQANAPVWLPSDICSSVTDGCVAAAIPVRYYHIHRGWQADADRYALSNAGAGNVIVVSDLFNFCSIHLVSLAGMKVVLDLAHCSFSTAAHYLNRILVEAIDIEVIGIVFSFGKGKYLRKGGGGCLVTDTAGLDAAGIDMLLAELGRRFGPSGHYADCDVRGFFGADEIRNSPTSTRMVIRPADYTAAKVRIEELRRAWKLDISDGLPDQLSGERAPEFYIWKRIYS
jgi:hypothetical protein